MTTLRERAAIAAMQGFLAAETLATERTIEALAAVAVRQADALLVELARTAPKDESPLRCTAAERELIEAEVEYHEKLSPTSWDRLSRASNAVRAERRAARETAGGAQ